MRKISLSFNVAISLIVCIMVWGFLITPAYAGKEIEKLNIGIGIDITTLNPQEQNTSVPMNMCSLVYDPLFYQKEDASLEPRLATGYDVSKDGLTYTLQLRKGVKFSDGTQFNAHAVKLMFDRAFDKKLRVPLRFTFTMIDTTKVVDDYTVVIKLKYPWSPFAASLSEPMKGVMSPAAIEKYGDDVRQHPVGAGPYKLLEWVRGDHISFIRNDDYWGPKPTTKKLVFKIIPEPATREAMLRTGEIDVCYKPTPTNVPALQADPNITVEMPVDTRVIFMAMNCKKGVTTDKRVRQAFNYAVDAKAILKRILFGIGIQSEGLGSPLNFGYHVMSKQYDYDPEKAKTLLKQAGFDFSRTVHMRTPHGRYNFDKQIAEAIQAYLQAIGVKVELRTFDWPTYNAALRKPINKTELELTLYGWGPMVFDADFTLFGHFHSVTNPPRGMGIAHYSNPEVDKLLQATRIEQDVKKRSELFRKVGEIIWDDAPWIFLHTERFIMAYTSKLQGLLVTNTEQFYPTYCTWK